MRAVHAAAIGIGMILTSAFCGDPNHSFLVVIRTDLVTGCALAVHIIMCNCGALCSATVVTCLRRCASGVFPSMGVDFYIGICGGGCCGVAGNLADGYIFR